MIKKTTKTKSAADNTVTISFTMAEDDIVSFFNDPKKLTTLTVLYQFFGEHLANLSKRANQGPKKKA